MTDRSSKLKARQQRLKAAAGLKPQVVAFDRPVASPATVRPRHRGLALGLLVVIGLPVVLVSLYLIFFARPQYASEVGFTIRQEEASSASELMGGLSGLLGNPVQSNADLLFEFVQSQEIVQLISSEFDLIAHYSDTWPWDPVFSIWPSANIEELHAFWNRMTRVIYNQSSGLIMVQVRAHDPESAQRIAQLIVSESERMINGLNETARRDSMRNAQMDLEAALERLRGAREALALFRARTQILDPQADIQGRMGVLNELQQQLASTLVEYDLLLSQTESATDPRVRQLERRAEVIRNRIDEERRIFTQQNVTVDETDYPSLLAQYESLLVDQSFAEATYQATLTASDAARSNADRQTLYLANFISPTLAQSSQYPQSLLIVFLTAVFATLAWAVMALIYYSLRDRG